MAMLMCTPPFGFWTFTEILGKKVFTTIIFLTYKWLKHSCLRICNFGPKNTFSATHPAIFSVAPPWYVLWHYIFYGCYFTAHYCIQSIFWNNSNSDWAIYWMLLEPAIPLWRQEKKCIAANKFCQHELWFLHNLHICRLLHKIIKTTFYDLLLCIQCDLLLY